MKSIFPKPSDFSWGESGLPDMNKPKLMVSHGTTHPFGEKCKTCDRIKKEYEISMGIKDKNSLHNSIHKEGFDAGYIKGYKKGLRDLADEMNKNIVGNEDSIMVAVKMFRTMDELLEKKRLNAIKKH